MAYCTIILLTLPFDQSDQNNKPMYALPLFPEIVEDYKLYLREDLDNHQFFSAFVESYPVKYTVTVW